MNLKNEVRKLKEKVNENVIKLTIFRKCILTKKCKYKCLSRIKTFLIFKKKCDVRSSIKNKRSLSDDL